MVFVFEACEHQRFPAVQFRSPLPRSHPALLALTLLSPAPVLRFVLKFPVVARWECPSIPFPQVCLCASLAIFLRNGNFRFLKQQRSSRTTAPLKLAKPWEEI